MRQLTLLLLLFLPITANAIVINEIMYDPTGNDSGHEWIEIYNNGTSINLSGWKLFENNANHALTLINGSWTLSAGDFAMIADNATFFLADYPSFSGILFDSAFSLSNSGEYLVLKNSSLVAVENITYDNALNANNNGNSLQRVNAGTPWNSSNLFARPATPGQQNFFEHDVEISLEKTDTNEITAHIINNGLSDENVTLDFYIDGDYSDTQQGFVASFGEEDFTFPFENLYVGNHTATINLTSEFISETAELNFTIAPLPEADVYATITINKTSNEYIIRSFPENATTFIGVFVSPRDFNGSEIIFGLFMFGEEFDKELDVSDLISEEIDFGAYDLCAEITDIDNYNDTDSENNFVCQQFTIEPESQKRKRIKTFVENENYGLNETLFWSAQVFPVTNGTVGDLTITLQKRNSQISYGVLEILELNLTENLVLSGNFTIPDDSVEGIYKIRAKFSHDNGYFDSQDSGQFWLNGLKDIGPANFTILQIPESLSFGGFKTIFVKFFAGNFNYGKLRFLVYGSPKQVLADTAGSGISASDFNSDVAIELENVKRGQEIYLALPAFAKQNCDDNYDSGIYRTRVRAYDETGKPIATADTNIQFAGKSSLCQTKESRTTGGRVGGTSLQQRQQQSGLQLDVTEYPQLLKQGENFALKANIINNLNSTKQIELYSYVFDGQKLVTEGSWTANKISVELKGKETKEIGLESTIKGDAELGAYTLRVRAKDGNRNVDADKTVEVKEKTGTGTTSVGAGLLGATGAAVYVSKTSTLNPIIGLFMFLLLVFVLVLIRSK